MNWVIGILDGRVDRYTDYNCVRKLQQMNELEAQGVFMVIFCELLDLDNNTVVWTPTKIHQIKDLIDTFHKASINMNFLLDRNYPLYCTQNRFGEAKNQYDLTKEYETHIIPYVRTKV